MAFVQKTVSLLLLLLNTSYSAGAVQCSRECMNGGNCTAPETCTCPPEWTGSRCETSSCSNNCQNGVCEGINLCTCQVGWTGSLCEIPICTPMCMHGGTCWRPDACLCLPQWTGRHCETSSCSEVCRNEGTCVGYNTCACPPRWAGDQCESPLCSPACMNGGTCTAPDTCSCVPQWTGDFCHNPSCNAEFCMHSGNCSSPNTCSCTPNQWEGDRCEIAICSEGFCMNGGSCLYPDVNCTCPLDQWTGDQCEIAICNDGFCLNGGNCSYPDVNCTCPHQWEGNRCETALCSEGFCENGGTCSHPDTNCTCPAGWEGLQCQAAVCRQGFCQNGGKCLYPDVTCSCTEGWTGNTCDQKLQLITSTIVYLSAGLFAFMLVLLCMTFLIVILYCKQCKKSSRAHPKSNSEHCITTDNKDIMLETKERKVFPHIMEEGQGLKTMALHDTPSIEKQSKAKTKPILPPKKTLPPTSSNPAKGTSKKMASALASEAATAGIIKGTPNIAYGVVNKAEMRNKFQDTFKTTMQNVDNDYELTTPMLHKKANNVMFKAGTLDKPRRPSQSVYADLVPIMTEEKPGPFEYDYVLTKRKSMPHALPMKLKETSDRDSYYI